MQRVRIIDAFTDRAFSGNPAGVCLLDGGQWPDLAWMQAVAAELNLSETAFALPLAGAAEADWGLRWFTPAVEVDLCGHATLATAHALRADGAGSGTVRFDSRSGILVTRAHQDGTITLDFPAAQVEPATAPDGLAGALGDEPRRVCDTGSLGDLLVEVRDESAVRGLAPDLAAVAHLSHTAGVRGIIVTALAHDPDAGHDFVSRFFAPAVGVAEDPVTGSAHTALAPFWSARLGRDRLTGRQLSARGGLIRTEVRGSRVLLTGTAVTVLDGALRVD